MRWSAIGFAGLLGCSFTPGKLTPRDDGGGGDSNNAIDGDPVNIDMLGTDACVSGGYVDRCAVTGGQPLQLTGGEYVYDTDAGILRDPGGDPVAHTTVVHTDRDPDLRLIVVTDLDVDAGATLYARGTLPVAIVASGAIVIDGAIDVGARLTVPGAGGATSCGNGATAGQNDGGGAAGGGGGGFGAAGGAGGDGDANGGTADGGNAGSAASALPTDLRGGCPGGDGGDGPDGGGTRGGAGGGVVLSAGTMITVSGVVRAGGGGGGAGLFISSGDGDGGGAGGGAGGMIVLDAPMVTITNTGALAANGGAGGGGSADVGPATPGANGLDLASPAPAGSGAGTTSADGGNGGYLAVPAGKTPTEFFNGGGGGGGGGVGFIVLRAGSLMTTGAIITPAAQ